MARRTNMRRSAGDLDYWVAHSADALFARGAGVAASPAMSSARREHLLARRGEVIVTIVETRGTRRHLAAPKSAGRLGTLDETGRTSLRLLVDHAVAIVVGAVTPLGPRTYRPVTTAPRPPRGALLCARPASCRSAIEHPAAACPHLSRHAAFTPIIDRSVAVLVDSWRIAALGGRRRRTDAVSPRTARAGLQAGTTRAHRARLHAALAEQASRRARASEIDLTVTVVVRAVAVQRRPVGYHPRHYLRVLIVAVGAVDHFSRGVVEVAALDWYLAVHVLVAVVTHGAEIAVLVVTERVASLAIAGESRVVRVVAIVVGQERRGDRAVGVPMPVGVGVGRRFAAGARPRITGDDGARQGRRRAIRSGGASGRRRRGVPPEVGRFAVRWRRRRVGADERVAWARIEGAHVPSRRGIIVAAGREAYRHQTQKQMSAESPTRSWSGVSR